MSKLHPLDAAEVALKQAARAWYGSETNTVTYAPDGRDDRWELLKDAAREYGKTWRRYVRADVAGTIPPEVA